MATHTIGRLARRFGLSRSTLLYYDSIDLLPPSGRSAKGYRLYSERDASRLEQVCLYRQAGLALEDIKRVLDAPSDSLAAALEDRLEELNDDIRRLRDQQRIIVGLLRNEGVLGQIGVMNKARWVALLVASGFTEDDMGRWHAQFEAHAPDRHQEFLEFLCIPAEEIRRIRAESLQGR